jgi:hypothetical protein
LETAVAVDGIALLRAVVAEAPRFPQLAAAFYQAGPRAVINRASDYFAEAEAMGEIDLSEIGLEPAAQSFVGLVRSEAQLHYHTHPEERPSAEQIDRWVANAVTTFVRAYGRAGSKGVQSA